MVEYQNILAAVGMGPEADWVLEKARAVAEAKRAKLSMLHVVRRRFGKETPSTTPEAALEHPDLGFDQGDYRELTALRDGVGALDGHEVTSLVAFGHPARMILNAIRERGVDFLVMGSHSRHGIAGYLGSTTDHVAHGVNCDLLVVKTQTEKRHEPNGGGYRKLLVPVDFSAGSRRVIEQAKDWAEHYNAEVTLLHIEEHFPTDRSNETITPEDQDPAEDLRRRAFVSMTDLAQQVGVLAAQEFQFNPGAAKHPIVETAERLGADLIVMGSHGVHGVQRLLGSTTDGVLHRAPCDVLLVRVRA